MAARRNGENPIAAPLGRDMLTLDGVQRVPKFIAAALCPQTDPEAFYPEKGSGGAKAAKAVCSRCEAREECLEWALANDERWGIWGAKSPRERRKLRRERGAA